MHTRLTAWLSLLFTAAASLKAAPLLPQPHGFGPPAVQFTPDSGLATSGVYPLLADEDGDGDQDLFFMNRSSTGLMVTGAIDLRRNDGSAHFAPPVHVGFTDSGAPVLLLGDVNGDGKADIIAFYRSAFGLTGDVSVRLRGPAGYAPAVLWHDFFCIGTEVPVVGDFNGDGRDDIATCTRGTSADVFVAVSDGIGSFAGTSVKWHDFLIPGNAIPLAADVNGDGTDELIEVDRDEPGYEGDVWVAFSSGTNFAALGKWHDFFCIGSEVPRAGDINGDGNADMLTFTSTGLCYAATSNAANAFIGTGDLWHSEMPSGVPVTGRINGDENADVLIPTANGAGSALTVTLSGGHAIPENNDDTALETRFGMGTLGVPYALKPIGLRGSHESRWTVVALVTYTGAPGGSTEAGAFSDFPPSYWQTLFFGGGPNVSSYFYEMSAGTLELKNAGVFSVNVPWVLGPAGVKQALADAGFNFAARDADGDGTTEDNELLIAAVTNRGAASAITSWWKDPATPASPGTVQVVSTPGGDLHVSCGVAACDYKYADSQVYGPAKEIAKIFGCFDLTQPWTESPHATLMSAPGLVHLDAWHKMMLGWSRPEVYDVRRGYPGSNTVELPQVAAGRAHPPLLFYNSLRGTGEKLMVEFRSNTWYYGQPMIDIPSPHAGAHNKAGYDSWVPGRGMMFWNVPCFGDHRLDFIATVHPGGNDLLDSAPGLLPDDVITSTHNRIMGGANNFINTPLAGDDFIDAIHTMTTQLKPSNWNARGATRIVDNASGPAVPEWLDGSALGMAFRVAEGAQEADRGAVQWGRSGAGARGKFAPFITRLRGRTSSTTFAPGAEITLEGSMGVAFPGGPEVVLLYATSPAVPVLPTVTSWSQDRVVFTLPANAPEGEVTVYINELAGGGSVISNVWKLEVVDCYARWAQTYWPLDFANPLVGSPDADPDMDGYSNIAEYVLGVPPNIFTRDDDLLFRSFVRDGAGNVTTAQLMWDERSGLDCGGFIEAETSTDLVSWLRRPIVSGVSPFPGFIRRTATIAGPGPRFFGRLAAFYDPNGRVPEVAPGILANGSLAVRGEIWPDFDPATLQRRWVIGWIGNYANTGPSPLSGLTLSNAFNAPQSLIAEHSIPLVPHSGTGPVNYTIGTVVPGGSGLVILRTQLPWGALPGSVHTLDSTLASGPQTRTASASVVVPILPPLITTPIAGTTCENTFTISGQWQSNVSVDVYVDAVLRGSVLANAAGDWSFPSGIVSAGSHDIYAISRYAGLTSDPSPTVTLVIDPTRFWNPIGLRFVDDVGHIIIPSGRLDPGGWSVFLRPSHSYTVSLPICCPDPSPLVTMQFGSTTVNFTDPDGDRTFSGTFTLAGGETRFNGIIRISVTCGGIRQDNDGQVTID